MLVSEDFRQEVEARVASALPGTVIGGCEIKPRTQCPNADLHGADLSGARLIGANLSGADLRRAYLWEANLSGANLSEALFFHTRMPDGSIRNQ
ncbi:MAG: pentapeptide repeat-containing protein [Chloroflexi bacterium]|nr:pentapeptide repeat-containing protein [Chloroflexota bacterium]